MGKLKDEVMSRLVVGTRIERAVKPIARAVGAACLDEAGNLKPDSGCAKRRDWLDGKRAKPEGDQS